MQQTQNEATGEISFDVHEGRYCVEQMNDTLIKNRGLKMISRTFYKDKKAAKKAQRKAKRKNRK